MAISLRKVDKEAMCDLQCKCFFSCYTGQHAIERGSAQKAFRNGREIGGGFGGGKV